MIAKLEQSDSCRTVASVSNTKGFDKDEALNTNKFASKKTNVYHEGAHEEL